MDSSYTLLDYRKELSSHLPVDNDILDVYKPVILKAIKWVEEHVMHYWHHAFFAPDQKIKLENVDFKVVFAEGETKFYIYLPDGQTFYIDIFNKGYDNISIVYKPHFIYGTRLKLITKEDSILKQLVDILIIKKCLQEKAEMEEIKGLEKRENPLLFIQYKNEKRKLSLLKDDYNKDEVIEHLHNKVQILLHNYNLKWETDISLLIPYNAQKISNQNLSIKDSHIYLPFHLYGHCTNCKEEIGINLLESDPIHIDKINDKIKETVLCKHCNTPNIFEFNLSLSLNLINKSS